MKQFYRGIPLSNGNKVTAGGYLKGPSVNFLYCVIKKFLNYNPSTQCCKMQFRLFIYRRQYNPSCPDTDL